jgi:hypothetical protein
LRRSPRQRGALRAQAAGAAGGVLSRHFQLKPSLFLGSCFWHFDPNLLAQSSQVAEKVFIRMSGNMAAQKFGHVWLSQAEQWRRFNLGQAPWFDSIRAAIAMTRSAFIECSAALGRLMSANTLPLLFVTLTFFFTFLSPISVLRTLR